MPRLLTWLTVLLFAVSILLRHPLLFLLAVLLALVAVVTMLWQGYALSNLTYTRRLGATRMFVGEETDLSIEIVNAKPLPLAWLKANDEFPAQVELLKGNLHYTHKDTRRMLTNIIALRFYERVRKRYRLRARQRGALEFGPVELSSGDMFGFRSQRELLPEIDRLIVYPRVVPITELGLPAAHPFGEEKTVRQIDQDPLRLMGVREYAPGDSPRRIHWKATARRASLQTKLFEPSAQRATAIFLDIQTVPPGLFGYTPEYLEFGISAAASIAWHLLDLREAVGLYVNGSRYNEWELIRLLPSRRPSRRQEILETLASLVSLPAIRFQDLARAEMAALAFGTIVVAISAAVTDELVAVLLDFKRAGHPVTLLTIGEEAPANIPEDLPTVWLGGAEAYTRLMELSLNPSGLGA